MEDRYYLYAVWGSCQGGNRNASMEDFYSLKTARVGIEDLKKDHPDASFMLIRGEEVERG